MNNINIIGSIYSSPKCLTGTWEGISMPNYNDQTKWTNTTLEFIIDNEETLCGKVIGSGISEWRNKQIDFNIEGTFNWKKRTITIRKQHLGDVYNNIVKYSGWIYPELGQIKCTYHTGVVSLNFIPQTFSNDNDNDNDNNNNNNNNNNTEMKLQEVKEEEKKQENYHNNIHLLHNQLSGVWEGESLEESTGIITKWIDVALIFNSNTNDGKGSIIGQGISEWKNHLINFNIIGTIDWEQQNITFIKQHIGKFTNSINYAAKYNISDMKNMKIIGETINCNLILTKIRNTISIVNKVAQCEFTATEYICNDSRLQNYKLFLSGMCTNGYINKSQQQVITCYRETNHITETEHNDVLKQLNLSKADYYILTCLDINTMFNANNNNMNESKVNETKTENENENDNECKICFEHSIDAVIMPCGHFAICMDCGIGLNKCPICRKPIHKIQRIFRA